MAGRLKQELEDVEFRIAQGLDRCDQLFDDQALLTCRHSQSKELILYCGNVGVSLDCYSRALKGNHDVIRIYFACDSDEEYAWFAETISHLPSVTSIDVDELQRLPPIQRDTPLFIDDNNSQSLETFLNNDQSLARTRDTHVFINSSRGMMIQVIAVSFVGPSSGSLILRLKHCAIERGITLTVLGTSFTLAIPESSTIDDINLHPISDSSSQLSFSPNIRNNLILQTSSPAYNYILQDLQLLDEDGNPYCQPSQHNCPATDFEALSVPDNRESS
jgi:hypothetical protein